MSWLCAALGLAAFACGGVLLAWSVISDNSELWAIGMPLTLAGQGALALGLILALERLWQSSADHGHRLREVDRQLSDLVQTSSLAQATAAGPSTAFYSHLSQGASPQLLLADLKGQLDLLALRMSHQR